GTRVHGVMPQKIDYSVEAAYQTGSTETGPATKVDVGAYLVAAEAGVTFGSEARPVRLGAGFDYLSGDDDATDNEMNTFNTLFADMHHFYGLMDIPLLSDAGLQDIKLDLQGTVFHSADHKVVVAGEVHNFRLARAGDAAGSLGTEVDVHARWAYHDRYVPTVGVSVFMPGDGMAGPEPGVEADNAYWFYAQGTVTF
ncbi:MAG: alginate export family protein, partial [Candidatus Krumholzibacteriia bacterium]